MGSLCGIMTKSITVAYVPMVQWLKNQPVASK